MKTMALTYSHKELQFMLLAASVEGLRAADLTGRGMFITYQSLDDSVHSIELWKSATKPELGDAKLLHRHKINKGEYRMNDIRLGVIVTYLKEQCEKFVDDITPILLRSHSTVSLQEKNPDPTILDGWPAHTSKEVPATDPQEETLSYYVLIDTKGNRKQEDFAIGYYNNESKDWNLRYIDSKEIDLKHMRWMYMPIVELDKK